MFRTGLVAGAGMAALVVQINAIAVLWALPGDKTAALGSFFVWQFAAALAAACWFGVLSARYWPQDRFWPGVHAFVVCLMAPCAGLLIILCSVAAYCMSVRRYAESSAQILDAPQFNMNFEPDDGHGDLQAGDRRFFDSGAPVEQRLAELTAVQSLLPAGTAALLRHRLTDPDEQVRLLAYGVLEKTESAIAERIGKIQGHLQACTQSMGRARLHGALAELHAEYVRLGFRQDVGLEPTSSMIQHHALSSLEDEDGNALMYHLLGRWSYD